MNSKIDPMRIAFLVSGNGELLQVVINACQSEILNASVACLITDKQCSAIDKARKANIPVHYFDKDILGKEELQQKIFDILCIYEPDLIILTFNTLLDKPIVNHFDKKIVNVHPGLLPSFKGFGAIHATFKSGVRYGGATIHFVDEYIDNGLIISQTVIPIAPYDSEEDYGRELFKEMAKMLLQVIDWFCKGQISISLNKDVIVSGANYTSYPTCPIGYLFKSE